MQNIDVLWIDDDISTDSAEIMTRLRHKVTGVKLLTAKTCGESEKLLKRRPHPPQCAIVDLIVPQGSWDPNAYHRNPGIEYIKHLRNTYGDKMKILAFTILITPELLAQITEAGASEAFVKTSTSFVGILRKIKDDLHPVTVKEGQAQRLDHQV